MPFGLIYASYSLQEGLAVAQWIIRSYSYMSKVSGSTPPRCRRLLSFFCSPFVLFCFFLKNI